MKVAGIRIGVNALFLVPGRVGGTEIYLKSLLASLASIDSKNEYLVFTNRETGGRLVKGSNIRIEPQAIHGANRPKRIFWEQLHLPRAVVRGGVDVLLNPGFTSPLRCPCPSVTVFHDLQHKRHPEYFRWWELPFWRLFLYQSAMTSDALIAVSEATREDLVRYYPAAQGKVSVIPHGVEEQFFEIGRQRRQREPEPYILCVSTLHPHKNIDRLIRAFALFRCERREFRLVVTGMRGHHAGQLERLVSRLGIEEAVQLTGWIPRAGLHDLYLRASAFVYPSRFEGFGLPVLEALAAGIPTACSSIPPLREVAAEAALLFNPDDEGAVTGALRTIIADDALRGRLAREGPERAARFSWATSASETLKLLEATASRP